MSVSSNFFIFQLPCSMSKILNLLGVLFFTAVLLVSPVSADTTSGTNFRVTKAATPTITTPSSTVAYAITILNISQTNQAPQTVTDTMPAGFAYAGNAKLTQVSGTQVAFEPTTAGQVLTWTFDGDTLQSIPANQSIVISYQVTVPSSTGEFTNTACLTVPENVCAEEQITVTTNPNTGIVENIFVAMAGAALLIAIGIRFSQNRKSFEGKVLTK